MDESNQSDHSLTIAHYASFDVRIDAIDTGSPED